MKRAEPVEDVHDPQLQQLVQDLRDTQHHYSGAGLSAPQVGVSLRVVVFGFEVCARYPDRDAIEPMVLLNPEYQPLSTNLVLDWEGCLSVPGLRGVVARHDRIRYTGFDLSGERVERTADGFHARLVQHEIDHLDGVLFVHRLHHPRWFGFEDSLDYSQYDLSKED